MLKNSGERRPDLAIVYPVSGDLLPLLVVAIGIAGIVLSIEVGSTVGIIATVGLMTGAMLIQVLPRLVKGKAGDISFFLIVPTVVSAFQNVYLSFVSDEIDASDLQLVVIMNFLYSGALFLVLLGKKKPTVDPGRIAFIRSVTTYLVILVAYALVTMVIFRPELASALASARNIVAPFLFFLIGIHASAWARTNTYLRYLMWLGIAAVIFGLLEISVPHFWQGIGLADLWEKKGIPVNPETGIPSNFYSSEQFNGSLTRRMAGPFADPVNFGTFLFSVFMAAWFLKRRFSSLFVILGIALAVSKGAALGLLTFLALWTRYFTSRFNHVIAIAAVVVAALAFYVFSLGSSTGSTTAHINGLLAGFIELPQHPLGRGLGSTGVLAGLFSEGAESGSEIEESGLGMILGQLGVIGIGVYIAFFVKLGRYIFTIEDLRLRLLAGGLLGGFILNAAFNEVALSPNSAATYFVILGLVIGTNLQTNPDFSSAPRSLSTGSQRWNTSSRWLR